MLGEGCRVSRGLTRKICFALKLSDVSRKFLDDAVVLFGSKNGVFQFPLKSVILILAICAKIDGPGGPLRSNY